jgi:hypothetical protein
VTLWAYDVDRRLTYPSMRAHSVKLFVSGKKKVF